MTLLSMVNLSAFYGPSQALFKVNLHIEEGEFVALLGRNGMGKSTTIKTICKMLPYAGGEIMFAGRDLAGVKSFEAARMGIGLVPEGRRCFTNLTVQENLIAAARRGHWDLDRVWTLFPRLEERQSQMAGSLSGGEQQMLAIGRALMTNPCLLILDEATEGLAPIIRKQIWAALGELKANSGLSFLVVDKSLKELAPLADKAAIMTRGETVWHGAMADLSAEVTDQYLGI